MPGNVDRGKLAEALDMVTILRQSYIDHGLWGDLIPILDAAQAVLGQQPQLAVPGELFTVFGYWLNADDPGLYALVFLAENEGS